MDTKTLQALIVDALEDVKAQEIRVFDTTHLTSMFDRIVVASGTSNRQTRALAMSVRDKVKSAGGTVISMEGEGTGEWVLVDLGDAVVHIMQPAIRAYYRLEELWGDKEVKLGAAKRAVGNARKVAQQTGSNEVQEKPTVKTGAAPVPAKKASAKKAPAKKISVKTSTPKNVSAKKTASKTASKTAVKTAAKSSVKSSVKSGTRPATKATIQKVTAKKAPAKKSAVKPARKTAAKKSAPRR
jgi:ribosome-associated protein